MRGVDLAVTDTALIRFSVGPRTLQLFMGQLITGASARQDRCCDPQCDGKCGAGREPDSHGSLDK
jgi:hypothetical protein